MVKVKVEEVMEPSIGDGEQMDKRRKMWSRKRIKKGRKGK